MSLEENKSIFEHLRAIGCCKCCSMRYLGERSHLTYMSRNIDEVLVQNGLVDAKGSKDESTEAKLVKTNPCIACLGLLEEPVVTETVEKVAQDVLTAQYDCETFACALTLPVCLHLRAHSLHLHLVDEFPERYLTADVGYVTPLKEAWKWSVAHRIAEAISKELDSGAVSDFFIEIHMGYTGDEDECNVLLAMHPAKYRDRARQHRKYSGTLFTRKAVETTLDGTAPGDFKQHFPTPPAVPDAAIACERVICAHNSIFIAGRYNKFSRTLSQTPWVIDGERRMESSVQEIICDDIRVAALAEGLKFSSSGREDVDVRMLGRGRPFACELLNPRHVRFADGEIRRLEDKINANSNDVFVRDLQVIKKSDLSVLKTGEEEKTKRYVALCVCRAGNITQAALDELACAGPVRVEQRTPIRVLHRRPQAVRVRVVHEIRAQLLTSGVGERAGANGSSVFKLYVQTQAGTYVKEFVHGDFGRTRPCLSELLHAEVDIVALDVEEIELDWPPPVNYVTDPASTSLETSSIPSRPLEVHSKPTGSDSKCWNVGSKPQGVEVEPLTNDVKPLCVDIAPQGIDIKPVIDLSTTMEVDSKPIKVVPLPLEVNFVPMEL